MGGPYKSVGDIPWLTRCELEPTGDELLLINTYDELEIGYFCGICFRYLDGISMGSGSKNVKFIVLVEKR